MISPGMYVTCLILKHEVTLFIPFIVCVRKSLDIHSQTNCNVAVFKRLLNRLCTIPRRLLVGMSLLFLLCGHKFLFLFLFFIFFKKVQRSKILNFVAIFERGNVRHFSIFCFVLSG